MDTYLTIIQYQSEADQVTLVQNSKMIFAHYEDPTSEVHTMLSIMTQNQKEILLRLGYYIQTVEKNPDMNTYVLLHHNSEGQAAKLASNGKVYMLTDNHTLLKLNEGMTFIPAGHTAGFSIIPFIDKLQQLAEKNQVIVTDEEAYTRTDQTAATSPTPTVRTYPEIASIALLIAGVIILITLIIAAFVFWRKTKAIRN